MGFYLRPSRSTGKAAFVEFFALPDAHSGRSDRMERHESKCSLGSRAFPIVKIAACGFMLILKTPREHFGRVKSAIVVGNIITFWSLQVLIPIVRGAGQSEARKKANPPD